jgi:hypothetical protein
MEIKLNSKHPDYHKSYYEKNKEKIIEGMNRPRRCHVCEKDIRFSSWTKHIMGKKHIKNETVNIVKSEKPNRDVIIELIRQINELKRRVNNELEIEENK